MSTDSTTQSEVIIACNPNAITPEQQERWLIYLFRILGQPSHMLQVRAHPLIIRMGIRYATMLCNTNGRYPEQITHCR